MSAHVRREESSPAYLFGGEMPEPFPHLWTCLVKHAQGSPDRLAIRSLHQSCGPLKTDENQGTNGANWTYAELHAKVEIAAARLFLLGIGKGDTLAAFLNNRVEWALFFWVAVRLDAVFVPLNPRMISSAAEINHALQVTKPAVLLALGEEDAKGLERTAPEQVATVLIRIILSEQQFTLTNMWRSVNSLMVPVLCEVEDVVEKAVVRESDVHAPPPKNALEQEMCVIFTSGITSLPKASISSYQNFLASALAFKNFRQLDPDCVFLQHMPVFHAWSICDTLAFWLTGATVVYPSPAFNAKEALAAIESAGCTHMVAVPSMIQAMIVHPSLARINLDSLRSIDLSGAMIFNEMVKLCMDKLKTTHVAATYGMTEGIVLCAFDTDKIPYNRYNIPVVIPCGTATPGARLRVCKPDSRTVLKRGATGELHMGGLQVTRGYLDRQSSDFYEEDGIDWLVTRDQARIDENGLVYILRQYKNLIIRGGENLSPAVIEQCLNSVSGLNDAQAVGIPDDSAGEVPVAVVRKTAELDASDLQIRQRVSAELDSMHSPQYVFDLKDDLGLDDFPKTVSGKIKKDDLKAVIQRHLSLNRNEQQPTDSTVSTVEALIRYWARVSGRKAEEISPDECAGNFVDSITVMQFCNIVSKNMHKTIAVEDLVGDVDILNQAQIIDALPVTIVSQKAPPRQGPPSGKDIPHVHGDDIAVKAIHSRMVPLLEQYNLDWWEDVEDIFPTDEKVAIMTRPFRLRAWNHRHAYFAPDTSIATMKWAVEVCLKVHPIFRSMIIDYGTSLPLYVVFRPKNHWFNIAVFEGHEVDSAEELSTLHIDNDRIDYASVPGPLLKVIIVRIRNSDSAGLIYFGHHSAFDAISMSIWHEDLDNALRTRREPKPMQSSRTLLTGNISIATVWTYLDGTPGKPHERCILDFTPTGVIGVNGSIHLPQLPTLKAKHNITAQIIFKTALALFNVHRTGSSQAFFGQPEAARVWPTGQGDPDPSLPNTMDIAGPLGRLS
ncbi:MAG: hypothetical protein LQ343_006191 [Gyalolechia ehrenbergii]|nr:MAG: hypothetical protein LQ343_006191 [Gyalolechia ehrenbergii]